MCLLGSLSYPYFLPEKRGGTLSNFFGLYFSHLTKLNAWETSTAARRVESRFPIPFRISSQALARTRGTCKISRKILTWQGIPVWASFRAHPEGRPMVFAQQTCPSFPSRAGLCCTHSLNFPSSSGLHCQAPALQMQTELPSKF